MRIGLVGLGRMGANMARRLREHGHDVVVHDRDPAAMAALAAEGAKSVPALEAFVRELEPPRAVWVMLPAGEATQAAIEELARRLERGDVVIDGGNTFWKDDLPRARALAERGIDYVDAGTSGGIWGRERGYCLMVGGEASVVARLEPVFRALAPDGGFIHAGPAGAGHFVKMVHNGIEYGMMQAYAEGFELLRAASSSELPEARDFAFDLAAIAEAWRHGSVIPSWLLDLAAAALAKDPALSKYSGIVGESGEGRWAVAAAAELGVPVGALAAALEARFRSRTDPVFAGKVLSALREGFGGHVEPKSR